MRIHVELKVCITSSTDREKGIFLIPVEHENLVLVTLETLNDKR